MSGGFLSDPLSLIRAVVNPPVTTQPSQSEATTTTVVVNRAPLLILWTAVVASRQGFSWDEALTLGQVGRYTWSACAVPTWSISVGRQWSAVPHALLIIIHHPWYDI